MLAHCSTDPARRMGDRRLHFENPGAASRAATPPISERHTGPLRCSDCSPGVDGKAAPYYLQTDLVFDSQDAAMAAFGSEAGKEVVADVANLQGTAMITSVGDIVR